MKKLNLKLGSIKEMLSKEQMKKVVGGGGYGCDVGTHPCFCDYGFCCCTTIAGCWNAC